MSIRQPLALGGLAAGNIGVAFLYQWFIVITIGPGSATDALFAGMTVPQILLAVASTPLTQVLVPLLGGEPADRSGRDAWNVLVLVAMAFTGLALLLGATAFLWVPFTVPGFARATQELTVLLVRINLAGMVFAAIAAVQSAVYQARESFVWPETASLCTAAVGLVALAVLVPRYGVEAAAWIASGRFAAQVLLLIPGAAVSTRFDLRSDTVQAAWRRLKPLMVGTAYYKTDPLVDRFLLSTAVDGSLSLFYFAQQMYTACAGILGKAIVTPLVPTLSTLHKARDETTFRMVYRRALWQVGSMIVIGLVVLGIWGTSLLSVLIGHGAVTHDNVTTLWWLLVGLGGMLAGGGMGLVTSASFYSRGDTRLLTRLSMLSYTIYVPVKIACFLLGGVMALAICVSAYYLGNLSVQYIYLERR